MVKCLVTVYDYSCDGFPDVSVTDKIHRSQFTAYLQLELLWREFSSL